MTVLILLFAIGILFIGIEAVIPGGILGSLGVLSILGGGYLAIRSYGMPMGIASLLLAMTLAASALFVAFRMLQKTKIGKRAFLTAEVTSVSALLGKEAKMLIGETAEALTLLSPSGYVSANGQRYEAFCQSGQAPVGSRLKIIGADNFRLIVTEQASA